MRKLLIIGAGGHGICCLDIARDMDIFDKISFFDDNHIDETINDYKVIVLISPRSIVSKYALIKRGDSSLSKCCN